MRSFVRRQPGRPSLPCHSWLPLFAGALCLCMSTLAPLASASPATPLPGTVCDLRMPNGTPIAGSSASEETDSRPEADWSDLQFIDLLLGEAALSIHRAGHGFQQAEHPDVRRIALRILESQAGEAKLLRFWRQTWFPEAGPLPGFDVESVRSLDQTTCSDNGPSDARLLILLIDAGERAAYASSIVSTHADHPELRNLAAVLLDAREGELRTMETLFEDLTASSAPHSSSSSAHR